MFGSEAARISRLSRLHRPLAFDAVHDIAFPLMKTRSPGSVARRVIVAFIIVTAIVLARSAVFVCWPQSNFDSNQAIIGLMAKHLMEGRAFPVLMYGQNYMLAVEAWLAAPVFLVAGVSVAALKLPLLAINIAIALVLVWLLQRESGLTPVRACLASIFFILPPPGTAAHFVEASGGIVEPLLYVLLIWVTRRRPVWCGLVLGIGFVHREFTAYGFVSLLMVYAARGLLTQRALTRTVITLFSAAAVWLVLHVAIAHGSAMGPGTTVADLPTGRGQMELFARFCFQWTAIPSGLWKIATVHWPLLFGTAPEPLRAFNIESNTTQGMPAVGMALGTAMLLASVRIATHLAKERRWREEYDFPAYLLLTAAVSVLAYAVGRCGVITLHWMRYDMLSILGAVGLSAWFLLIEPTGGWRSAWVLLVLSWIAVTAASHGRLWSEYLRGAPPGGKQQIIDQLKARGARYAISEYRDAYAIAFLTNEQIIVASDRVRIEPYQRQVAAHSREAVRIQRRPCRPGRLVLPDIYFCDP